MTHLDASRSAFICRDTLEKTAGNASEGHSETPSISKAWQQALRRSTQSRLDFSADPPSCATTARFRADASPT